MLTSKKVRNVPTGSADFNGDTPMVQNVPTDLAHFNGDIMSLEEWMVASLCHAKYNGDI